MRVFALAKRIVIQMLRDKRALALMMIAPLFIITILHYLFSTEDVTPRVGVSHTNESFIEYLKEQDVDVVQYDENMKLKSTTEDDELDAMVTMENDNYVIIFKNEQTGTSKAIEMKVKQSIASIQKEKQTSELSSFIEEIKQMAPQLAQLPTLAPEDIPEVEKVYVYGDEETTFFDQLAPIFVSFFVFFFVFIISGIAILRERTSGTLERLVATPIKRRDIVFGYILGYGLFAVIQTLIVVFYAIRVLDIILIGSIWHVILINLVIAFVALTLGTLLSAFANSEFQMMQFIPLIIIPQIFFAGIIPVDTMANWLQFIAKCMPMYYAGNAIVDVMYKGLGFEYIQTELFILLGFGIAFMLLNILALKKYRRI